MFKFVEKRNIFFIIPLVIIIAGIIALSIFGINADIDFTGGYTMTVEVATTDTMEKVVQSENIMPADAEETEETPVEEIAETEDNSTFKSEIVTSDVSKVKDTFTFDENVVRNALKDVKAITSLNVIKTEDGFVLKMNEIDAKSVMEVKQALSSEFGQIKVISEDKVSATVGAELWGNASMALIIAAILMLIYISLRFELLSGLSAVIALVHDLLIMISIYAIFRLPVNTSFIAAMLTILGYSINATIVIFDRIRENIKFARKETFAEVTNKSIAQSLTRSVNTSITTLLTIVMVYILGVKSVKEFALPIIIGIVCGTYSSIFIACPMWAMLKGVNKAAKK